MCTYQAPRRNTRKSEIIFLWCLYLLRGVEISHGLWYSRAIIQKAIIEVPIKDYSTISSTFHINLIGFKQTIFGEKDPGLDLHKRDFTRFWLNKYNL